MWVRQYEKGRWNGLELNILTTSIDGGKRLHVSEIPYADLPSIKVMGSAASSIDLTVVFVGSDSLARANALLRSLDKTPTGELEHPWLGELALVFETYSQEINTTLGVAQLSLSFRREGKLPTLTSTVTETVNSQQQASSVETVSTKTFAVDVEAMDVAQVNTLRQDFTHAVGQLVGISNKLKIPSQTLVALNQELNSALVAISSIANAPGQFAEQLSITIDSVASAVRSEDAPDNEAVDNSRTAQATMLKAINPDTPSAHYNVQMVTAAVKMSKDIARLESDDTYSVLASKGQPTLIKSDLIRISEQISNRIDEVTDVSTSERLELYHELVALKEGVDAQCDKVKKGSEPEQFTQRGRFIPALALAHSSYSQEALITALNSAQHPLFMRGTIAMRVAE